MRFTRQLLIVIGLLPWLMGAAVYRWVDENGVVNYSQLEPEGVHAELVSADTGRRQRAASRSGAAQPPPQTPATEQQTLTESQQQMLADLQAAERERQAEIARVREANCQEARNVLGRLASRGRIRVTGENGVERVMPEDERQRRIEEAQRAVAANCAETASR